MSLPNTFTESLLILARGAESVSAVMGTSSDENRFTAALEALQRLSQKHQIPIAIVGGLGAIRYGYPAATQDIDIAVAKHQLETILRVAPEYGFKIAWQADSGWHTVTFGDVEINIVPEGGKAKNSSPTTIPGPIELGVSAGLGYANLAGWAELKISSGRQKDRAHVVEVLKKSDAPSVGKIRKHLANVHESYLATFIELLEEAKQERKQEDERGGR